MILSHLLLVLSILSHMFGRTNIGWFQLGKVGLFCSETPYSLNVKRTRVTLVLILYERIQSRGFHVLQIKNGKINNTFYLC